MTRPFAEDVMLHCLMCGSTELEWSADGQHARCRRCPSLFTRNEGGSLRQVVVEAPGGGYNPEFQAIFERELGFQPRHGSFSAGPSYGGGGGAMPDNPMAKMITLMVVAFIGFVFVAVGAYVAWVLYASLPH